jgi:hypothetical protein
MSHCAGFIIICLNQITIFREITIFPNEIIIFPSITTSYQTTKQRHSQPQASPHRRQPGAAGARNFRCHVTDRREKMM